MLNGLSLFSGIGGLELGLSEWIKPVIYCEIEKYSQAVLVQRMESGDLPKAPIWDDVTTLAGELFKGSIDIIYGGFPCQDISVAGRRKGLEGERSGLFFEIIRLANEIQPTFLFLENVPNIRTKGLSKVGRALADAGYDCRWCLVSAEEVGANHLRKRWWCLAKRTFSDTKSERVEGLRISGEQESQAHAREEIPMCDSENVSHSKREQERCGNVWWSRKQGNATQNGTREANHTPGTPLDAGRQWWETEPDVGRVVDGVSFRVDRIRGLGNAVVPLQAEKAFKRLIGIE